jgi:hypothetical protein
VSLGLTNGLPAWYKRENVAQLQSIAQAPDWRRGAQVSARSPVKPGNIQYLDNPFRGMGGNMGFASDISTKNNSNRVAEMGSSGGLKDSTPGEF